ncbi:hypothetical protein DEU35_0022 [Microbacterium sp. AG157]|uniref:Uncharacterized protein n=1 Tax=Microbacterium testaceum TaxID=2033 RepID=A0A4Y3QI98_MICTE|nr:MULTISPECIES: hypothetical protein [Microbacterium]REC99054.1 hypothetical protein DEU35_0022 [Microbacterium sp. AG157]GEB44885.1 hypothetical protein MTE01_08300 [Microbacterium testaceum]
MPQDDAHELLSNILDRCAAMERPFWEVSAEKRAEVARNFGSPAVIMRVGHAADEDLRIAGGADLFLGTALLAEIAIEIAEQAHTGRSRTEAVSALRARLNALLGPAAHPEDAPDRHRG